MIKNKLYTAIAVTLLLIPMNTLAQEPVQIQTSTQTKTTITNTAELGERLFFDPNLSLNRTQSCATCHSPSKGFSDPRDNGVNGAASLGDDGKSIGDRNTPALGYGHLTPDFKLDKDGLYSGGQFWDGRANDLKAQAGGPILNGVEMAMPDKAAVLERLKENPNYIDAFKTLFDEQTLDNADQAFDALTSAIEHFEKTDTFSSFDSKYDRYLAGSYTLTQEEDLGRTLFFSKQFTNCNLCHQLNSNPMSTRETFSSYQYHNIGVPVNQALRISNRLGQDYQDMGLLHNPKIAGELQAGKFKTPSLRNVAVTGPFMHNGVFKDLKTVVMFYNKYNSKSAKRQINPETDLPWQAPEVAQNIAREELTTGPALDDRRVRALVAFLKLLTDERYETLIPE